MREIEKTCENCEYEYEDVDGSHCRHCIHNAEEHFEPKKQSKHYKEIRAKAIDEFVEALRLKCIEDKYNDVHLSQVFKIAEQMKGNE
jgi:predicted molibdopterin-dependent oxidoreductase YjgC